MAKADVRTILRLTTDDEIPMDALSHRAGIAKPAEENVM
jgi:hypothetical protein